MSACKSLPFVQHGRLFSQPAGISSLNLTYGCRAPGGYSAAVLKIHPAAQIFGLTLPKNEGGVSFFQSELRAY
jgi:hypothetical protein